MKRIIMSLLMMSIYLLPALPSNWTIASLDGNIKFILSDNGDQLSYRVKYRNIPVIETSVLGLVMDGESYGRKAKWVSSSKVKYINDAYTLKSGKRIHVVDHCKEQVFSFRNSNQHMFQLVVRIYDNGVAFRYILQGTSDRKEHKITQEQTEFAVVPDGKAWIHPYDWNSRKKPSYEQYCNDGIPIRKNCETGRGWAFPMLFETNHLWMMITEAALDGTYPATHIDNSGAANAYRIRFPEQDEVVIPDDHSPVSALPWKTPWRVAIIGPQLNTIFESQLVENLNPPCSLSDTSWIKPGRACWSWWYKGSSVKDYPTQLQYVDFCQRMGWEYDLIDAGWQNMTNGGTMEDVVRYANTKGVGIWLWYHSGAGHEDDSVRQNRLMCDRRLRRTEMKRIHELGVKGIKVDFFDTDKQRIINLYFSILKDAADNQLMVDFHGATLPRGLERTYPNLMSTEAVRGAESLGQQLRCDKAAWHNTIVPFTRNVVGSMDYTPVTFSNKIRQGVPAIRRTTVAHQLSLSVVFESGFQCFADRAEAYDSLPDEPKQFLKDVPVVWDESRLLAGYPGKNVVVARRSGSTWYVAGINGMKEELNLSFQLPEECRGNSGLLIKDGKDGNSFYTQKIEATVSAMKVTVLPEGGFVAVFH